MSQPRLALIVAQASNRVIGRNNKMPWHLPEDLQYFKRVTLGKPIIMGRKTFESIGRPLPGRTNIVITRQPDWHAEGAVVVSSLEAAIARGQQESTDEVMVIGGAQIYAASLPLVDRVYLTQVHRDYEGDARFPELGDGWREVAREDGHSERGDVAFSFLTFERCY
ncbi:dihydrofolate reductase [Aestuariicella hydrocarbonica]|uniref:Dihydrofolate reductase n=1 Tax=Pseudomaricurvus hydrocarbonicus TaxID=1470433 RepID=A0A9E5ML87_9GAMM|nr:dihydrofolate reductase [Aestuariicella hydrocarbonica]NHO66592.1 dihydrofolate reductase [Aestuariicella hydrocarbonica]